jgi:hypothetical protein
MHTPKKLRACGILPPDERDVEIDKLRAVAEAAREYVRERNSTYSTCVCDVAECDDPTDMHKSDCGYVAIRTALAALETR